MALEVFDFPYHTFKTDNPPGVTVKLGGSYTFSTPPSDPDQRLITLSFSGMAYYLNEGGQVDATIKPKLNMFNLTQFYLRHKLYKSFQYTHPVHGTLVVKFNKPLSEETVIPGGFGVVKDFSIELLEIP